MFNKLFSALLFGFISTLAVANPSGLPTHNNKFPFGQNLAQVLERLKGQCSRLVVNENLPLEVPTATLSQTQIDCFDYKPLQHIGVSEWIFADDFLDIVWVLSPMSELEITKSKLTNNGITPDYSLPNMADFYLDRGFGFRYQPTEALYYSDRLIPYYRAWLENL